MPHVVGNIPNFINGISQQPQRLRLSSQAEAQVNCYSTVAKGLIPRPGTEHVAKIASTNSDDSFVHWINRDTSERYSVIYDDAVSNTSPQLLTAAEMNFASGWTVFNGGSVITVSEAASVAFNSPDSATTYYAVNSDGVADRGVFLYPAVALLPNTTYTFSIWMTPPVSVTNLKIILQGSDLVAPGTNNIGVPASGWNRYEVTATTAGSVSGVGGTSAFELKIVCDTGRIDVFCPMLSVGATAPTQSVWGNLALPRLKVFDILDGTEQQVWIPNGESYLETGSDPSADLKALTVADYTFFVNDKVLPAQGSTVTAAQPYEALIVIETIQPGSDIKVYINGTLESTNSISDTDPTEQGTGRLASLIRTDFLAPGTGSGNLSLTYTIEILPNGDGNVIYIKHASTDFTVSVRDDGDADGIRVIKKSVQTFGELPRIAKQNMLMEVKGNADNDWSAFWVKYDGNDGEDGVTSWTETVGPGVTVDFNDATMPHIMTRTRAGHFSFRHGPWSNQTVGDAVTNAPPSFIGEYINDVYFTEGRLGFLAGENTILSATQNVGDGVFNFWRTSVTSLLDADPIDVSSTHTKVSILRHAVPYQEQLLLFSDQTQFRLTKGQILSPKTVGIEVITEFESSRRASPMAVGNFVFFIVEKSDYATVREYFVATENDSNEAREITGHVPEYIPSGITLVQGSSNEDLLLIHAPSEANALYVYKYFWSGNQKAQSSWSKWTFPDVSKILGFYFYESDLYLVMKRADGVFLEKAELDAGSQDGSGLGFDLGADRKVLSSGSKVSASYSAGTGKTTYTFTDHTWASIPQIVGVSGNSTANPPGYLLTPDTVVGDLPTNTIVVEGDTTGDEFMFGVKVEKTYKLSEFHVKGQGEGGTRVPIAEGRLQIRRFKVVFADTAYFKVRVTQEGRSITKVYEYTGRNLGSAGNLVNAVPIQSGVFSIPVSSLNTRAEVEIFSDSPLPFRMLSADWTGLWHSKGKRI